MGITYKKGSAVFSGVVGGEEAEALLEWLNSHPKGKIDLADCTHLHPANLQVVMASKCRIQKKCSDRDLAVWIDSATTNA